MQTLDRKIKFSKQCGKEIEILDKDNRKHLVYATVIGVVVYLCALAVFGVH